MISYFVPNARISSLTLTRDPKTNLRSKVPTPRPENQGPGERGLDRKPLRLRPKT